MFSCSCRYDGNISSGTRTENPTNTAASIAEAFDSTKKENTISRPSEGQTRRPANNHAFGDHTVLRRAHCQHRQNTLHGHCINLITGLGKTPSTSEAAATVTAEHLQQ